jgi:hypothetical protein
MENTVFSGLVTCWCFAIWPTSRSPLSVKPTTEGVSRAPEELIKTLGEDPSITATTESVVPKSIPIILLAILNFLSSIRVVSAQTLYYNQNVQKPCQHSETVAEAT